jgi:hypothetical protein
MNKEYENCIKNLAEQISEWGIGIIVGAGFSKAVIGDNKNPAKNWKELFVEVITYLNYKYKNEVGYFDDIDDELSSGKTLPQIATNICYEITEVTGNSYEDSKNELKRIIRSLVNWVPSNETIKKYRKFFEDMDTRWVVTTNYDEVLEAIFGERGYPLNPEQPLTAPSDNIPIYHIHGSRRNYRNLIVTHEDYVPLFRPGNYRESKLTTMMTETPVLVLGYSLSDLNLLAALDQSNRILESSQNFSVVLAQYTNNDELCYRENKFEKGGYKELEINSIEDFLEKLIKQKQDNSEITNHRLESQKIAYQPFVDLVSAVEKLSVKNAKTYTDFVEANPEEVEKIAESILKNPENKIGKLKMFEKFNRPAELDFFNKTIAIIMQYFKGKSVENGEFSAYAKLLKFIMYVLNEFELTWFTPQLMELITKNLEYALRHSGDHLGESYEANEIWNSQAPEFYEGNTELWNAIYLQADIDVSRGKSNLFFLKQQFEKIMRA